MMVLGDEEELVCEVCVDGIHLEHVSNFKCVLDNQVLMRQNAVGKWRVGRGYQAVLGLWLMLGVCSLSVLGSSMSHCWCLFLHMVVR